MSTSRACASGFQRVVLYSTDFRALYSCWVDIRALSFCVGRRTSKGHVNILSSKHGH